VKDPTKSLRIEREYQAELVGLFKRYKMWLPMIIDVKGRALAPPPPPTEAYNPSYGLGIHDLLDKAAEKEIIIPGKTVNTKFARKSYKQGKKFADKVAWHMKLTNEPETSLAVSFDLPVDQRVIDTLVERNNSSLKGVTDAMNQKITMELSDSILKGESISQMTKRITGVVEDVGIVRAQMIARTETMKAVNEGTKRRYQEIGIEKMDWLTALDERTCPICRKYDGKITPSQTDGVFPPAHPNCRCAVVAHTED
jgi:SPP1 gp7 family putative phage head morphogenesis protein